MSDDAATSGATSGDGPLPISNALVEASTDSLAELFSRDPMGLQAQDLDRIILELRSARKRWAEAENAPKPVKALKAGVSLKSLVASSNAEEMGL